MARAEKNKDLDAHQVYSGLIERPQMGGLEFHLFLMVAGLSLTGVIMLGLISWAALIFAVVWWVVVLPIVRWATAEDPDFIKVFGDGILFERHYHPHSSVFPYGFWSSLFTPTPVSNSMRSESRLAAMAGQIQSKVEGEAGPSWEAPADESEPRSNESDG